MGFSLNNLTLFGLVLAIGIVVDDAIVVVEAVEHHIEHGLSPRDATIKAMSQVSGPVIAVGLVLSAVFVPCAFISGMTGQFFRQFALTIAASTIISTFNSLTLSPALAACCSARATRRPTSRCRGWLSAARRLRGLLGPRRCCTGGWTPISVRPCRSAASWSPRRRGLPPWLVRDCRLVRRQAAAFGFSPGCSDCFNRAFNATTNVYLRAVGVLLRAAPWCWWSTAACSWRPSGASRRPAKGFIPAQDMGYLIVNVQTARRGSSIRADPRGDRQDAENRPRSARNRAYAQRVGHVVSEQRDVSNFGSMFVILDDFDDRRSPDMSAERHSPRISARPSISENPRGHGRRSCPPRRFAASAARAGSSSWWKTDWRRPAALQELQTAVDDLVEPRAKLAIARGQAAASTGCQTSFAPTRRSSTSTSTASSA